MRASAAFVLDRLPQLLADDLHLGGRRRLFVANAREAEEIGRKLRAARVEDEGPAHAEGSAEEAGLEDDVVARRRLPRRRAAGRRRTRGRPVVPREHERGEVDFVRQLDETLEGGGPGIEGRRPGLDLAPRPRDLASAPAGASPAFPTSRGRCEACSGGRTLGARRRPQRDAGLAKDVLQRSTASASTSVSRKREIPSLRSLRSDRTISAQSSSAAGSSSGLW